jgi:hypothetical protein
MKKMKRRNKISRTSPTLRSRRNLHKILSPSLQSGWYHHQRRRNRLLVSLVGRIPDINLLQKILVLTWITGNLCMCRRMISRVSGIISSRTRNQKDQLRSGIPVISHKGSGMILNNRRGISSKLMGFSRESWEIYRFIMGLINPRRRKLRRDLRQPTKLGGVYLVLCFLVYHVAFSFLY